MPLLISDSPLGGVSGPGSGSADLGLRIESFLSPELWNTAPLDKAGELVGSGSDAGNSSGTEPSTTTGTSDLTNGRGSSSASDNDADNCRVGVQTRRTPKKQNGGGMKQNGGSIGSDFSRKFALTKEIARSLSAFEHGCSLHDVHISRAGVDTLESHHLMLKDFITMHPQTQFFKVDEGDDGTRVRLKKGGWVLSQED